MDGGGAESFPILAAGGSHRIIPHPEEEVDRIKARQPRFVAAGHAQHMGVKAGKARLLLEPSDEIAGAAIAERKLTGGLAQALRRAEEKTRGTVVNHLA